MQGKSETRPENIFCAFDFSETAGRALEQSLILVRRHEARLILAHIVDLRDLEPFSVLTQPRGEEFTIQSSARKRLEELASPLREEGLDVETIVEVGNPEPNLVSLAERSDADLIVIGTRGLTGFKHLLLGSIAEYVLRRSARPVLTVQPEGRLWGDAAETVILPTDMSDNTAHAARAFDRLNGPGKKPRMILTHANRTPFYMEHFREDSPIRQHETRLLVAEIERRMAIDVALLQKAGFETTTVLENGDAVSVITDLAATQAADLIVMSTRGQSPVVSTLLGRTTERIVRHAACPVLTVAPIAG